MIDTGTLWFVIITLGVGSFLLRFAFLGFIGDRPLPDWLLRHLRFTAVAVLPALVAPLVVFSGEGGSPDPARITAGIATVAAGMLTRNLFVAIGAGAATLFLFLTFIG